MKSLSEPADNINQVKSKKKKPQIPDAGGFRASSVAMNKSRRERTALPGVKSVSEARKRTSFAKGCKDKDAAVYAIQRDED